MSKVRPFKIDISDAALADLRMRLLQTRLPERETVGEWRQGLPLDYAKAVLDHWINAYDWRARALL